MGKVNRMEQAKVQNLALTAARSRLLALDINGIITNYPDVLAEKKAQL